MIITVHQRTEGRHMLRNTLHSYTPWVRDEAILAAEIPAAPQAPSAKHLVMLTTRAGGFRSLADLADRVQRLGERCGDVRNLKVVHQAAKVVTVCFDTDTPSWPYRLAPELRALGLVLVYTELMDWVA
ncbi:hypothetical protein [Lysobacter firmicutimachus]|uniref:DUF4279 domain-containing protein n=2 Tax=Lysobacter firmicutimachus TaxID=1792846 RepID=A0ABU8DBL3_9GAMM